jgi:hypothetical protein
VALKGHPLDAEELRRMNGESKRWEFRLVPPEQRPRTKPSSILANHLVPQPTRTKDDDEDEQEEDWDMALNRYKPWAKLSLALRAVG